VSLEAWCGRWRQRSFSRHSDLHADAKPPQSADEKTIDARVRFAKRTGEVRGCRYAVCDLSMMQQRSTSSRSAHHGDAALASPTGIVRPARRLISPERDRWLRPRVHPQHRAARLTRALEQCLVERHVFRPGERGRQQQRPMHEIRLTGRQMRSVTTTERTPDRRRMKQLSVLNGASCSRRAPFRTEVRLSADRPRLTPSRAGLSGQPLTWR